MKCPVCKDKNVKLWTRIDKNASCLRKHSKDFVRSGETVEYLRCDSCGHIYCPDMIRMPKSVIAKIYGPDYSIYDPDMVRDRPVRCYELLTGFFFPNLPDSHLDYGSGYGLLTELLRDNGWNSKSYDPFLSAEEKPEGQYSVVSAFEVAEHSQHPRELFNELSKLTKTILILSTRRNNNQDKSWWYVSPKNGHINIYSEKSLNLCLRLAGFLEITYNDSVVFGVKL